MTNEQRAKDIEAAIRSAENFLNRASTILMNTHRMLTDPLPEDVMTENVIYGAQGAIAALNDAIHFAGEIERLRKLPV